jgi:hypothetical protein
MFLVSFFYSITKLKMIEAWRNKIAADSLTLHLYMNASTSDRSPLVKDPLVMKKLQKLKTGSVVRQTSDAAVVEDDEENTRPFSSHIELTVTLSTDEIPAVFPYGVSIVSILAKRLLVARIDSPTALKALLEMSEVVRVSTGGSLIVN